MPDARTVSLAINSGSSSIKLALFSDESKPRRLLSGAVERMGSAAAALTIVETNGQGSQVEASVADHAQGAEAILKVVETHCGPTPLTAIGHRIVHGGPRYSEPQAITADLLDELKRLAAFVPNHLPAEITMIEAFQRRAPRLPQIACFDTAFHHHLPDVARCLPIPWKYETAGIRRYGFHGLSYAYLMEELLRAAGPVAAGGRVILAHLGSGASLAAVKDGQCIDTSMGFTPSGGLMMGTRSGDLDPGMIAYLIRTESLTAEQLEDLLNIRSGLLGVSGVSADMRDLLAKEQTDPRCALAISMFCYQARKWIGAFAAALGGVDTIVFSAGIGEHIPAVRQRICEELSFLGVRINGELNTANAPIISDDGTAVVVRVIPTDEELMIAKAVNVLVAGEAVSEPFRSSI